MRGYLRKRQRVWRLRLYALRKAISPSFRRGLVDVRRQYEAGELRDETGDLDQLLDDERRRLGE